MKKLISMGIALLLVLVAFAACSSKNSIPSVDQIKEDLIGKSIVTEIVSVESIEIQDTENRKSTDGLLKFTAIVKYTDINNDEHERKSSIYYKWTDNAGWKFEDSFVVVEK